QWRKDSSGITDATNSSVSASTAGGYDVIVANGCGAITSSVATLTVNVGPSIGSQPVSTNICSGGTASFSVGANGTAPFTYQWRKDGSDITDATNSSVSASTAGGYDVIVANGCGAI